MAFENKPGSTTAQPAQDAGQADDAPDEFDTAFKAAAEASAPPAPLSSDSPGDAGAASAQPEKQDTASPPATTQQQKQEPPDAGKPASTAAPSTTALPAADAAPQPDIWANATPEQKAAYDALANQQNSKAEQRRRSAEGRERRRSTSTGSDAPAAFAAPSAGSKGSKTKEILDSEGFKTLKKDFPEVAAPISEALTSTDERVSNLEAHTRSNVARAAEQEYLDRMGDLEDMHPGWEKLTFDKAKEFQDWKKTQPRFVQELVEKNAKQLEDVDAAADVLSRFKDHLGISDVSSAQPAATATRGAAPNNQATRRTRQIEGSSSVPSRGAGKGSGPPDDFDGAFAYEAQRAGGRH